MAFSPHYPANKGAQADNAFHEEKIMREANRGLLTEKKRESGPKSTVLRLYSRQIPRATSLLLMQTLFFFSVPANKVFL